MTTTAPTLVSREAGVAAGMTVVTVGSMVANLAGYLLHVPASRWLGISGYSGFASLLAAQLLLTVPALAVQTVVAREMVRGSSIPALRVLGWRCAGLSAVIAAVLTPLVTAVLHVSAVAASAALVSAPISVLLYTQQGILQGGRHFRQLAVVIALAGIGRVVPAVAALALGGGMVAALAAAAVGTAVVSSIGRISTATVTGSGAAPAAASVLAVIRATQVQLVLMALTSIDLVLARMVLDEAAASRYALGAVATKAAFWLPQAVGVVLYPRMAHPEHSIRAVRATLGVLTGLGVVTVVGVGVAAPLAPLVAGPDYAPISGLLWAFALDGALLAVLQGALLAAIAGNRTRLAAVAWIGLACGTITMLIWADSTTRFLTVAVAAAAVTAVLAAYAVVRSGGRPWWGSRPEPG